MATAKETLNDRIEFTEKQLDFIHDRYEEQRRKERCNHFKAEISKVLDANLHLEEEFTSYRLVSRPHKFSELIFNIIINRRDLRIPMILTLGKIIEQFKPRAIDVNINPKGNSDDYLATDIEIQIDIDDFDDILLFGKELNENRVCQIIPMINKMPNI